MPLSRAPTRGRYSRFVGVTIIHEKNLACVESSKFSMLVDHEKNDLVLVIFLN